MDLNDFFFDELQDPSVDRPDILIASIGSHEVVGWSGRPRVKLDFPTFQADTEMLLSKINGIMPKDVRHKVLWWKGYYIHKGESCEGNSIHLHSALLLQSI